VSSLVKIVDSTDQLVGTSHDPGGYVHRMLPSGRYLQFKTLRTGVVPSSDVNLHLYYQSTDCSGSAWADESMFNGVRKATGSTDVSMTVRSTTTLPPLPC